MAAAESSVWPEVTTVQASILVGLPVVTTIIIFVLFNCIWVIKEESISTKAPSATHTSSTGYGTVPTNDVEAAKQNGHAPPKAVQRRESTETLQPGQVAGDYHEEWSTTFDYTFLYCWILAAFFLFIFTYFYDNTILFEPTFWRIQAIKFSAMMLVSLLGGLVCRYFCVVDEKGYIVTTVNSVFKVNYTRKLQHFAAYMIPLLSSGSNSEHKGPLELAWGDLFTLLAFLVLIKPLRERFTFFMLQFNSLDRPEDRPNTLKWIIAGNILPGFVLSIFFRALFDGTGQGALVFILVYITGIGDGLAEPVGIFCGRHKYKCSGWFSKKKYTRSWEGSMCVFMSGMVFPALLYGSFKNFNQCLAAMVILAPTMAYAEATAPHTMDTPVLMGMSGFILYAIIKIL